MSVRKKIKFYFKKVKNSGIYRSHNKLLLKGKIFVGILKQIFSCFQVNFWTILDSYDLEADSFVLYFTRSHGYTLIALQKEYADERSNIKLRCVYKNGHYIHISRIK